MNFSTVFSGLRKERGYSQRKVSTDLNISQALLSHYENGIREPRLDFVVKACEYYGVSADYMLGMNGDKDDICGIAADIGKNGKDGSSASEDGKALREEIRAVSLVMSAIREIAGREASGIAEDYMAVSACVAMEDILEAAGEKRADVSERMKCEAALSVLQFRLRDTLMKYAGEGCISTKSVDMINEFSAKLGQRITAVLEER